MLLACRRHDKTVGPARLQIDSPVSRSVRPFGNQP